MTRGAARSFVVGGNVGAGTSAARVSMGRHYQKEDPVPSRQCLAFAVAVAVVLSLAAVAAPPARAANIASDQVFNAINPCRIVDTRKPGAGGRLVHGVSRTFNVVGSTLNTPQQGASFSDCGIPGFSGGLPLSMAAGADLVGEYVGGILGEHVRPDRLAFRPGVTMLRHFEEVFE